MLKKTSRTRNRPDEDSTFLNFSMRHANFIMVLFLVIADASSLLSAYAIGEVVRTFILRDGVFQLHSWSIPFVAMFLIIYSLYDLYNVIGTSPVHEIKKLFGATSIGFFLVIVFTFWEPASTENSRLMLLVSWIVALGYVQFNRWLVRIIARKFGLWGVPVVIIGNGKQGQHIAEFLSQRVRLGMLPVLMVDGFGEYDQSVITAIQKKCIRTAILVVPEMSKSMQNRFINDQRFGNDHIDQSECIDRIILISSLGLWGSVGVTAIDLDGVIGLTLQNNLMRTIPNFTKRCIDLFIAICGGVILLPLFLLITIAIRIDSEGRVLFKQKRIGRQGRDIYVWKFRTMYEDAEKVLQNLLDSNPMLNEEWGKHQKLKNDPRITWVGRFLRKFSIDEFPQLLNVIKGEMSLVGPRPIVENETGHYKEIFEKYKKVRPGMTGMWQVSGRNDTGYGARVTLDEYYINNWSIWLDIYIIIRTAKEVLFTRGAY